MVNDKPLAENRLGRAVSRVAVLPSPSILALPRSIRWPWSYSREDSRDLRLDLLRGFAAFAMVVDHLGGASYLYTFTGGNGFFVSAAEAFIFISGLVAGIVYRSLMIKKGFRAAATKMLQRAWTLYKLTVALSLLFAAASIWLQLPWAQELQVANPLAFALDILTLRQTLYLTDVPLLYTLLMALAPVGLWLLSKNRAAILMAISGALWLAFQIDPAGANLPWTIQNNPTFHFAAWQLLFFGALTIGYYRKELARRFGRLPWPQLMILFAALFGLLLQLYQVKEIALPNLLPGVDTAALLNGLFLKSSVAAGRLVAVGIVFPLAYLVVTYFWRPIELALGWILLPLGQNALYVYAVHVGLMALVYGIVPHLPWDLQMMGPVNTSMQLGLIVLIWGMVQRRVLFSVIPR